MNNKAQDKFVKAALSYCSKRDSAVGNDTEQWHQYRNCSPEEQKLFDAYRALKYPNGKVYN